MQARLDSINRLYQETFKSYKTGRYGEVLSLASEIKAMTPDTLMVPKLEFMETVAKGVQSDVHNFETLLKGYVKTYPDKEPTRLAKEILTLIGRLSEIGGHGLHQRRNSKRRIAA